MCPFMLDVKETMLVVTLLLAVTASPVGAVVENTPIATGLNGEGELKEIPLQGQYAISAAIGQENKLYHIKKEGGDLKGTNSVQSLKVRFSPEGIELRKGEEFIGLTLSAWGYGNKMSTVKPAQPKAVYNRVEYQRGLLTEWYVNGPFGLQQGFTVAAAPPRTGKKGNPLRLSISIRGGLQAVLDTDRQGLVFCNNCGNQLFQYKGLKVIDASGREARAWLELKEKNLLVTVEDSDMRYPLTIDPFIQKAKLTASDGDTNDNFGWSVAKDGNVVVVGAYHGNLLQGSAYVFVEPAGGWTDMTQTAKLTASDADTNDYFGSSIAISANVVVVGAFGDDVGANIGQGSAYVFVESAGGWTDMTQTAKLTASDGEQHDWLGESVAISDDVIVAGARYAGIGSGDQGAAYVFVEPAGGWTDMTQTAKLTASDGVSGDELGFSVAISGYAVVVGAQYADVGVNYDQGATYVFVEPAGGWTDMTQTAKLTSSDGITNDAFGLSVAINDGVVVAGAPSTSIGPNISQGSAYVFVEPAGGWTDMTQTAKLTASDGEQHDRLGESVAISDDVAVVGTTWEEIGGNNRQGSAYVFVEPAGGWTDMTQTAKLIASDGAASDHFGKSVAVNGDLVLVGAPLDDNSAGWDGGSAYVYYYERGSSDGDDDDNW